MFNALVHLNWLAIVLATLAYYLLGAAWFALMFGKAWDRSIGYDRPRGHRFGIAYYIVPLVSALAVAIAVAIILTALAPENLGKDRCRGRDRPWHRRRGLDQQQSHAAHSAPVPVRRSDRVATTSWGSSSSP